MQCSLHPLCSRLTSIILQIQELGCGGDRQNAQNDDHDDQFDQGKAQGESVNILLNFTQFFETRIEYRFQIFTAHSCDFLLPSYARLA